MDKITVYIPFYNDVKYLSYAIQSVINQTYKSWKLVLLDDGSNDGSLSVAKSFLSDARVELITDGINRGLIGRLNQSIDMCLTEYYVRMDADDIMHPQRLEEQLSVMEANSEIDVLGTAAYSIDAENHIRGLKGKINNKLEDVTRFIHPSVIMRTSWLKENKYSEKALRIEDSELWIRAKSYSTFKTLNKPLLYYREFGGTYYKKYQNGVRGCLNVLYTQRSIITTLRWLKISLIYMFKSLVYQILSLIHGEHLLIKRRYRSMSENLLQNAVLNLKKAINEQ